MGVSIKDLDNDNASFSEGTLTDVVAVNDGLELANNPVLSFDSDNDYVECPEVFSGLTQITIEAWINLDNINGDKALIGKWNINSQILLYHDDPNGWRLLTRDNNDNTNIGYQSSYISTTNQLLHFAVTGDVTDVVKFYENGVLKDSGDTSGSTNPIKTGTSPYYIGADDDLTRDFDGLIDEVRIWNRVLTQQEIQDNMNKELTGNETGLVAYYKMNEGSGTTLIDSAGTNDGNIIGATWQDNYISWNLDGTGTRQSPQLDLSTVNDVASSSISWVETLNSQIITIETSVDGGSTWQAATNGGAIPNLPADPTTLDVRQTLDTNDTTVTPVLESLTVDIDTAEENTDSGSLAEEETYTFYPFQFTDSTQLTSAEDSNLAGFTFNDSGSFNIDAENWYTRVTTAFDEGSLTSEIENYDLEGWIQNPKATSQWQNVDENTQDLWTKVDKNTADWNKG